MKHEHCDAARLNTPVLEEAIRGVVTGTLAGMRIVRYELEK
ncbi:MAG: hypothetical protein ACR2PL_19875 [Dehalococcoidia bacterium]